ncbi:MAG: hypothetical protein ACRDHP_01670, partial [Ktedonobacterales bacterium]
CSQAKNGRACSKEKAGQGAGGEVPGPILCFRAPIVRRILWRRSRDFWQRVGCGRAAPRRKNSGFARPGV